MLGFTPTQLAILAAVFIIGAISILVIAAIRARRQRRPSPVFLFFKGRIWWLPPYVLVAIYARMTSAERAFVERLNDLLVQQQPVTPAQLVRYEAIVAFSVNIQIKHEPGTATLFTDAGQAAFRRRIAGRR